MAMSNLYQHDRHARRGRISDSVRDALISVFCSGHGARKEDLGACQELLRFLRLSELWLECDCRQEGCLMSPRQLRSGALTLVRHGKLTHIENCPFFRLQAPDFEPPVTVGVLPLRPGSDSRGANDLGLALRMLLQEAGYDRIESAQVRVFGRSCMASEIGRHYAQIDVAGGLHVDGIPLRESWVTHVGGLNGARSHQSDVCVTWFVGVANEVGTELVRSTRDGKAYRFPVQQYARRSPIDGPFWVIGKVNQEGTALSEAYAWPVVSAGLLLPVESERHRGVAKVVCQQLCFWRDRFKIDATLRVPLETDRDAPDLWLEISSEQIAIDIVPLPGHARSRSETMRRAESRAGGNTFLIDGEEIDDWRRRLTLLILRFARM